MPKYIYLVLFVLLFVACSKTRFDQHSHDHGHSHDEHGHSHEEALENIRITEFSDNYEIFAEISPFIVGHESEFIIHYTKLDNFKPILKGNLSIIISGAINENLQIDTVFKSGIFKTTFKPQSIGDFNLSFIVNDGHLIDTISISGLKSYSSEDEAKKNEIAQEEGISFLKEEAWKIEFAVERIKSMEFNQTIKSSGRIIYNPSDEVNLIANSSGTIEFLNNSLFVGGLVSQGAKLFTIKPNTTRDDNYAIRFEQAKSELNRANKEFVRISELYKLKISTEKEYLDAQTALESAESIFKNYSQYTDGKTQVIKATKGGVITKLLVQPGQFVEAGSPIAVISNDKNMLLSIEIPNKDLVSLGQIENINLDVNNQAINLNQFGLKQVGTPIIVGNSSFSKVQFRFDNKLNLIPNSVYSLYLKGRTATSSITVPKESIWEDQGHYYVFVQKHGEMFEKRQVEVIGFDGVRYLISTGLSENEIVVTKGTYRVMLASNSSSLPSEGHTH